TAACSEAVCDGVNRSSSVRAPSTSATASRAPVSRAAARRPSVCSRRGSAHPSSSAWRNAVRASGCQGARPPLSRWVRPVPAVGCGTRNPSKRWWNGARYARTMMPWACGGRPTCSRSDTVGGVVANCPDGDAEGRARQVGTGRFWRRKREGHARLFSSRTKVLSVRSEPERGGRTRRERPPLHSKSPTRTRRALALRATALAVAVATLASGCASDAAQRGYLPGYTDGEVTNQTGRITELWVGSWVAALAVGVITWGL